MYYLLPKWRWETWVIIGLAILIVVMTEEAYALWKHATSPKSRAIDLPKVILDFNPAAGDLPTKRKRYLILRNVGSSVALNSTVEPFTVGDITVACDPLDRLLPGTPSPEVTAEIRKGNEVTKPCLVQLDPLLQFQHVGTAPLPLFICYTDLAGGKHRVEYSCTFKSGINECQLEFKGIRELPGFSDAG
jgi:hypothetical protein